MSTTTTTTTTTGATGGAHSRDAAATGSADDSRDAAATGSADDSRAVCTVATTTTAGGADSRDATTTATPPTAATTTTTPVTAAAAPVADPLAVDRVLDAMLQWAPFTSPLTAAAASLPAAVSLDSEQQASLAARLALAAPHLPPAAYCARVLGRLVAALEAAPRCADDGVADALYEALAAAQSGRPPFDADADAAAAGGGWIAYPLARLPHAPPVRVWKSARFSDIATNVWPATFALVDAAALAPRALFARRHVVEVGAGTGLAALLARRLWCAAAGDPLPAAVTVTDGDPRAVTVCRRDIAADDAAAARDAGALPVTAACLRWGVDALPPPPARSGAAGVAVLGSDLVYDPADVPALVATLAAALPPCDAGGHGAGWAAAAAAGASFALIASTLRVASTYAAFTAAVDAARLRRYDVTDDLAAWRQAAGGECVRRYASVAAALLGEPAGVRGEHAGVRGEPAGMRGEHAGVRGEHATSQGEQRGAPLRDTLRLDLILPPVT